MYGIFEVTVKNMIHPLEDLTYVGSGSAIKKKKKKKKRFKLLSSLKFSTDVKNIVMEGSVSQIFFI